MKKENNTILVTLKDGQTAIYTKDVLRLMMTDPYILSIIDLSTGEVLKETSAY